MIFNIIILAIVVLFIMISIIDKFVYKEKKGYYEKFNEGFEAMGPIALSIIGIIVLVPIIGLGLEPLFNLLFGWYGGDSSMGIGMFLANDMGGFQLAVSIAKNENIGLLSGLIYASMMGATIVFSIPVGLSIIKKEDIGLFSKGVMYGVIAIPLGVLVGGLLMGIPIGILLINLIGPVVISVILALLLIFAPQGVSKGFSVFAGFIKVIAFFGLVVGVFNNLIIDNLSLISTVDVSKIFFFNKLNSVYDGIIVAGAVGIVLAGMLPFIHFLNKILVKPFKKISEKTGMSEKAMLGLLTSSANNIAMFSMLDEMEDREKIINIAFSIGAAFVIGDHLAFTAANAPSMIGIVIAAKLVTGIFAVIIALIFTKERGSKNVEKRI